MPSIHLCVLLDQGAPWNRGTSLAFGVFLLLHFRLQRLDLLRRLAGLEPPGVAGQAAGGAEGLSRLVPVFAWASLAMLEMDGPANRFSA
jgi:hypothetical protein